MRVFHLRNAEYGLKSIRERRLKISRIMELNDPFEFLAAELSNKKFRKALQATKAELARSKGLICFSKNWRSPVQWSHYADHHKGLCMEFEVPKQFLAKVCYVSKRINCPSEIDFNLMQRFLTTKFRHWSYEEEYRQFIELDPEEAENGMYFSAFSDHLKLKTVIVGDRSPITRTELGSALGSLAAGVEVFKSRPAFRSFRVVRNENEALWA